MDLPIPDSATLHQLHLYVTPGPHAQWPNFKPLSIEGHTYLPPSRLSLLSRFRCSEDVDSFLRNFIDLKRDFPDIKIPIKEIPALDYVSPQENTLVLHLHDGPALAESLEFLSALESKGLATFQPCHVELSFDWRDPALLELLQAHVFQPNAPGPSAWATGPSGLVTRYTAPQASDFRITAYDATYRGGYPTHFKIRVRHAPQCRRIGIATLGDCLALTGPQSLEKALDCWRLAYGHGFDFRTVPSAERLSGASPGHFGCGRALLRHARYADEVHYRPKPRPGGKEVAMPFPPVTPQSLMRAVRDVRGERGVKQVLKLMKVDQDPFAPPDRSTKP